MRLANNIAKLNVLFPLETTVREFEFRLFLASNFINRDRRIFIGRHEAMLQLLPVIGGGMYVGKNMHRPHHTEDLEHYRMLKDAGIIALHLDEEGGIYPGGPDDWRDLLDSRVDPTRWESEDYICTWGDFQRDHYASLKPSGAQIRTTGHPRFDLYRQPYKQYFEQDAAELRKEYGSFVLINSNFALANHQYGLSHIFSRDVGYDPSRPGPLIQKWLHARHVMANVVELIHDAANRFPDHKFIIRPHPSEEFSAYEAIFAGRPNVLMRHEGPVGPWMIAADAVIHDGCTTGVEAHFAGVRLINYRSQPESSANVYLPNLFGVQLGTKSDVLDALADVFKGREHDTKFRVPKKARDLLRNFDAESYESVIAVMEEAAEKVVDPHTPSELGVRLAEAPWQVKESSKDFVRPLFRHRYHMWKNHRSRFVDIDPSWVNPALERVAEITGKRMVATFVSSRLFYLDLVD